ncbi:hypothetical protein GNY06_08105 [Elizabethkingia argentiflava]|uniref:Peptidase S24/S26A/S26B/S26C domain-containing protein n=1 Tax=Elizabethkingia argenteiflava TaxID=2681556 RepID=A0A845PU45_9FLAO|nr:S24/S26 family peptidase [Elizabethkingia argenteiflava]NAW51344.1 hypothetical protein [Elizabethkingia argenteiflava]
MQKKILRKRVISNELFFQYVLERLEAEKKVKILVAGTSMEPFLQNGDQVVLKRAVDEDIRKGVIVLARFNQGYILHRIVHLHKEKVTLAGDGNISQVEIVSREDILGVVIQAYRLNREIMLNALLGMIWYKLRWIRSIANKVFRIKLKL